jgi:PhnB protein
MFSDAGNNHKVNFGDNFSMSVDCKTDEEIEKLFKAMSEGGHITMPLQDTFWGAKFGMCTDKFGVNWMFNHDKPKA